MLTEFCSTYTSSVAGVLQEAIAKAGLELGDITMIFPHNVNLSSWQRLIRELDVPGELIYLDNVPRYGHCQCADAFLNLVSMRKEGRLEDGGIYVLVAVGLGAIYSAMVIGG